MGKIANVGTTVKTNVAKAEQAAKIKVNEAAQKTSTGISNLKVNNKKLYELTKANTQLVLNTAGHSLVALSVVNLVFHAGAPLLLALAGAAVFVKTLQHLKETNKEYLAIKKLYK